MMDQSQIYQRIGEFVVSFQWLENRIREMGWFILDPSRKEWPPKLLRKESTEQLFIKVERLFLNALPKCGLDPEHEESLRTSFGRYGARFHALRRARNKILHSAFIELKAGGEEHGILRSNPQIAVDPETGESLFDQEFLTERSFGDEMAQIADLAMFFNMCYTQLIHRFPQPD